MNLHPGFQTELLGARGLARHQRDCARQRPADRGPARRRLGNLWRRRRGGRDQHPSQGQHEGRFHRGRLSLVRRHRDVQLRSLSGGYGFDSAADAATSPLRRLFPRKRLARLAIANMPAEDNRLPLVVGTDFAGDASFNNRNTFGPFGQFDIQRPSNRTPSRTTTSSSNPAASPDAASTSAGEFAPATARRPCCGGALQHELRNSLISKKNRYNALALFNYELTDNLEAYFEGSYYKLGKRTHARCVGRSSARFRSASRATRITIRSVRPCATASRTRNACREPRSPLRARTSSWSVTASSMPATASSMLKRRAIASSPGFAAISARGTSIPASSIPRRIRSISSATASR